MGEGRGRHKILILSWGFRTVCPSPVTVRMEYLFVFQFWYCELCVENRWGGGRIFFFLIFVFGRCLIVGGWWVVGWHRKSYQEPAEIASFSSRDFSQSYKLDTFWHVISTGYFYVLFLWAIAVSDFRCWEIHRNLSLPLFTTTFTVIGHIDSHFYKYICFKYRTVWNSFYLLKYTLRYFVLIRIMVYIKNSLREK